jgi:hypothetical protein
MAPRRQTVELASDRPIPRRGDQATSNEWPHSVGISTAGANMSAKSHLVRVLYATAELNAFVAEVTAEYRDILIGPRSRVVRGNVLWERPASHPQHHGQFVFGHACRLGLEGIVSKRRSSPYKSGTSLNWIKSKTRRPRRCCGSRPRIGAGEPRERADRSASLVVENSPKRLKVATKGSHSHAAILTEAAKVRSLGVCNECYQNNRSAKRGCAGE